MRIETGGGNLINIVDRALGGRQLGYGVTGVSANESSNGSQFNGSASELYIISSVIMSVQCVGAPLSEPFFTLSLYDYDDGVGSLIISTPIPNLAAGEVYNIPIPMSMAFNYNRGLNFTIAGIGNGGSYAISLTAPVQRITL